MRTFDAKSTYYPTTDPVWNQLQNNLLWFIGSDKRGLRTQTGDTTRIFPKENDDQATNKEILSFMTVGFPQLKMSQATVYRRLADLQRAELVERTRTKLTSIYTLTETGQRKYSMLQRLNDLKRTYDVQPFPALVSFNRQKDTATSIDIFVRVTNEKTIKEVDALYHHYDRKTTSFVEGISFTIHLALKLWCEIIKDRRLLKLVEQDKYQQLMKEFLNVANITVEPNAEQQTNSSYVFGRASW
jgi:DNA-binding PadR family transcriptional regulator